MPPKKAETSKKTVDKQKQKTIEDKTFGLKNKKGTKQQKFIQQVEKQVAHGNRSAKDLEKLTNEKLERKEQKKREQAELNELFKPVADLQKIAQGVDPKSVLCVFFKQGQCKKGDKCKFSHDLAVERKAEKRGIYNDGEGVEESMDDWDINKLSEVVSKKHEDTNRGLPPTTIICKYFLDVVENSKYGWFWECPNGKTCHYKHALPPGFVLKRDKKKMDEQHEVISLEELIEKERQNLGLCQTKVTLATFMEWKRRRRQMKLDEGLSAKAKRESDFKLGRTQGISGREMFEFNPNLVLETNEEDTGEGDVVYTFERNDEDEDNGPVREIDDNAFMLDAEDLNDVVVDEELFNLCDLDELEEGVRELEIEP